METVEQSSVVTAPADDVWAWAVSEEGINDELRPILRMTMPRDLRGKTIDDIVSSSARRRCRCPLAARVHR